MKAVWHLCVMEDVVGCRKKKSLASAMHNPVTGETGTGNPECELVFVDCSNIRDGPGIRVHLPSWPGSCRRQLFGPVNANEIVSRATGFPLIYSLALSCVC
jgi:hypothetical protein